MITFLILTGLAIVASLTASAALKAWALSGL